MDKVNPDSDGDRSCSWLDDEPSGFTPNEEQVDQEICDEELSDDMGSMGARQVHDVDCIDHLFQVYCPNDGNIFILHRSPVQVAHEYMIFEVDMHFGARRLIWTSC